MGKNPFVQGDPGEVLNRMGHVTRYEKRPCPQVHFPVGIGDRAVIP